MSDNYFDQFDAPAKSEGKKAPAAEKKPSGNYFDQYDAPEKKTAPKKAETSLGGRIAGSVAGVGDMLAGTPGMAYGLGGAGAQYIRGLAAGEGHKQASQEAMLGLEKGQHDFNSISPGAGPAFHMKDGKPAPETAGLLEQPFARLMAWAGYGKDYDEAAVTKVMGKVGGAIEKGSGALEKATGGAVTKEDGQLLADAAMTFGGPHLLGKAMSKLKGVPKVEGGARTEGPPLAEETLKKYEEQGKTPAAPPETAPAPAPAPASAPASAPAPSPISPALAKARTLRGAEVGAVAPKPALSAEAAKGRAIRRGESGAVDPKLLGGTAAIAGGAAAGYALAGQDKLESAIIGGLAGAALLTLPKVASQVKENWTKALKPIAMTGAVAGGLAYADKEHPIEGALLGLAWGARGMLPKAKIPKVGDMTIDELTNLRNGNISAENRNISNVANGLRTIVKEPARREAVTDAVEARNMKGLSTEEVRAAHIYRGFTKAYGEAAKNVGVLNDFIQNYVTHVVEKEGLPQSKVAEFLATLGIGEQAKGAGTSPSTAFAKHRKYGTFEELQKALEGSGLRVKTKDIAEITEIYGRSMNRAIENKRYLEALKAGKTEEGKSFVMEHDRAPADYVHINSPQLRGMAVHPDMAPELKFVMEAKNPNDVVKGLLALSLAQKRLNTSLSFFHAANLMNAYIAAGGGSKASIDAALKAYRTGGLGDTTDLLLRSGLKVEGDRPIELDQKALTKIGQMADGLINKTLGTKIGVGEKVLGAVDRVQTEVFDKLTWDYLHTGIKLAVAIREFERLSMKHTEMPKEQVAQQVSSFVNDTFGGLDWYRVAAEAESKLGRKMAMAALSPGGRTGLQIAMFAPDWTFSTFRALYKALPDVGGGKQPLTRELHRAYALRTAVLYMTLLNGINMATSGHSILDNKDPTKLEYKDGTTQQVAKHAMEGYEWLLKPKQTALNKLGPIIKEPLEQLQGREYLSADNKAPPIQSKIGHALKAVLPLPAQQGGVEGRSPLTQAKRTVQGMVGMPVYGMTHEEKAAAKARRARLKELRGER